MYYLGVDIGGTGIKVGVTDEKWNILAKDSVATNCNDHEAMVKDIADLCKKVCNDAGVNLDDVKTIGMGIPGALNSKEGIVLYANNLNMRELPIVSMLKKHIDKEIYISNDANVAALGEAVAGGAKDYDSAVVVTLGTGVGGGIILNSKIWEGHNSVGAEVGHIVIEADGEPCTCGRKGCWEAYSSATALIRDTKRAIDKNPNSILAKVAQEEGKVSGRTVFTALKQNDSVAKEVFQKYVKYLAEGVANICNLIGPAVVLLGGGVSNAGDDLIIPLREEVKKLVYGGGKLKHADIKVATLGNDAGIVGAAALGK